MDQEYHELKKRVMLRTIASDIIYSLPTVGFWVKNMNFEFLDISDDACQILYDTNSNNCVGKNDFEIARERGLTMSENMFAEICRASDLWVLNNPENDKYKLVQFVELITGVDGKKHIWKVMKGIHPNTKGNEKHIIGFAVFMDVVLGNYENALKWFEKKKPHLHKINNYLYRYD